MFRQLDQVYNYYREIAESYRGQGLRILKTDTHNESGIWSHSIPLAPILNDGNTLTCIEIEQATLDLAKKNYPDLDFRMGDILTWEGEYDAVLDFSTIDHVLDFRAALENYRKLAPKLSCIVWLHDGFRQDGSQYWFCEADFRQAVQDVYGDHESKALYAPNIGTLHHFICPGNTSTT